MAQKRPKRTPQQAQGIGHMYCEQNKPEFGPKHPGVGIQHTLARLVQSARRACAGLLARKKNKDWVQEGVLFDIKHHNISLGPHSLQCEANILLN